MIITCNNCNKKFDIDSSAIPEKGRLLLCSGCNHKWFFKKKIINESVTPVKINKLSEEPEPTDVGIVPTEEKIKPFNEQIEATEEKMELLDENTKDNSVLKKTLIKNENKNLNVRLSKNKKNYNILSLTIVFIISFIALIILLDTFDKPISKIIPNIEFLLYNLYESISDIVLFLKDLI